MERLILANSRQPLLVRGDMTAQIAVTQMGGQGNFADPRLGLDVTHSPDLVTPKLAALNMDPSFLNRDVNAGFSGGEKKRNEILQMAVLAPDVAILDEIDSGLDVDALRAVAKAVNGLARPDSATLMVTHYTVREARGGDRRGVAPRRNAGSQDSERPRHPPHPTPLPTAPARPRRQ